MLSKVYSMPCTGCQGGTSRVELSAHEDSSSEVIRRQSEAIITWMRIRHQRSSEVIRGHQEAIITWMRMPEWYTPMPSQCAQNVLHGAERSYLRDGVAVLSTCTPRRARVARRGEV